MTTTHKHRISQMTCRYLLRLGLLCTTLFTITAAMAADWAVVNDMAYSHSKTNAVRLNDGRIMVQGELYDTNTGTWSQTSLALAAYLSTSTLLMDGRVLLAGHHDLFGFTLSHNAQIFDPATNTWSATTPSLYPHGGHVAVRLNDGRVLVAGSFDGGSAAEIFDPISATWTSAGNMNTAHNDGFIELLANGKVMVGGGGSAVTGPSVAGIEIYDPANNTWTSTTNPPGLWRYPSSTALTDGRILVVAGDQSFIYDSSNNSWIQAANLNVVHWGGFSLTRLADGQVLAAGGTDVSTYNGIAAEVYNSLTDTWTRISDMPENRGDHAAALLDTGHVLLAGGTHSQPTCCDLTSAVLYTPPGTPAPPVSLPPPPPPITKVFVSDLDGISDDRINYWVPRVTITISNSNNQVEGGSVVTGTWSSGFPDPMTCTTDSAGQCTISNVVLENVPGAAAVTFTVTDVARTGKVYDPSANSDPDGDSNGTSITINPPPPPLPPVSNATSVFVTDMDGTSTFTSNSRWQAAITLLLKDENGNPVNDASVLARWSGAKYGNGYCTSEVNGICTLVASNLSKSRRYVKLKVMTISHATLTYDATANSDPDGDSDGTTIRVNRP